MFQCILLAGAMATLQTAQYSGVDLDDLVATPHRSIEVVATSAGRDLVDDPAELSADGSARVDAGGHLSMSVDFEPGTYALSITGRAAEEAAECSLEVGGEPAWIHRPVVLSGEEATHAIAFSVESRGTHNLVLGFDGDALVSDLTVRSFRYTPPRPPMRPELAEARPRIFITEEDIPSLRERVEDPRVQHFYRVPGPRRAEPPAFVGTAEAGQYRGLKHHALAYLLTEDPEHLEGIVAWLDAAADCPGFDNDLQYEFILRGVALTYDWLYHDLPDDTRRRTRDLIVRLSRQVYEGIIREAGDFGGVNFQQNHTWFAALGLMLGSAAVYGEVPEAEEWLGWSLDRAERIFLSFSPDGGFHEGAAYWDFSMPTLYRLVDLYESFTGLPIPAGDDGLHGQAEFRFRHLLPGLEHTAPLEDTQRLWGKPAVRVIAWEAKRYQDPVVMGIADLMWEEPKPWSFKLLWLDETLESVDPRDALPTARYYPDVETVFARTGWDDDDTWLAFVSRPMGGHKYAELCARYRRVSGLGHSHPHQGHFLIHGRGETLVDEPGHTYEKRTRDHNTILVNGEGQFGDGVAWPQPNPGRAHITDFVSEGDVLITVADPSSAYPEELGLARFERTLAMIGRDLVIVHDRLAADPAASFSWLLHHYGEISAEAAMWSIARGDARLLVRAHKPDTIEAHTTTYRPVYTLQTRHGEHDTTPEGEADINMLSLVTPSQEQATFLVSMQISDADETVPEIAHGSGSNCDVLRTEDVAIAFRRENGEMSFETPWGETLRTDARCVVAHRGEDGRRIVALPAR